ncbi:glycosyltransferase family 4 protein [Leptolyngbya sp. DQ-M1]|uniref:glycosyltransferase n=1 Tax=Leptolyngbya sp. DQ-M1 TaxID=2933920 RepID=UPI0032974B82
MKILNLTTAIPSRYGTGADIASQHFIDAMKALGHSVSIVGYRRWGDRHPYGKDTIEVGERHIETSSAGIHSLLWAAIALFRQLPYSSAKYYSNRYVQTVRSLLSQQHYDVIVLEHSSQLCWLKPALVEPSKIAVLAHNVEHEIYQQRLKSSVDHLKKRVYQREAQLVKQMEANLAATSEAIWTLSSHDASYFRQFDKTDSVKVFELPVNVSPVNPTHRKTYDIGMIGSWIWKPNADGLCYFFDQVYPHLPAHCSIRVAGRGAEWLKDKYHNVEYLGFVEDAQAFLAEARAIAIPSICGGGVQLKTLEAIGLALPVVATPFALRGLTTLPTTVYSAEQPGQFAQAIQTAIDRSITPDDLESVKTWVENRYNQFLHSVETALTLLTHEA